MRPVSKKLDSWADFILGIGVVMILLSILGWLFSSDDATLSFVFGFALVILSPVFRGLSVVVQNAEGGIRERAIRDELFDRKS